MMQAGYVEVARIIATFNDDEIRTLVARSFAHEFGRARPQFKRHLFMKACNVSDT